MEEKSPGGLPPLAQQSLHLLLVLGNHCTGDRQLHNPFRQALFHMSDLQGEWTEGAGYRGCGVGVETGVRVGRGRLFCSESGSELESVKFCRLRVRA